MKKIGILFLSAIMLVISVVFSPLFPKDKNKYDTRYTE